MTYAEVMRLLEKLGTAQNRKVYKRHGAGEDLFGVSFANLARLKRRIKTDHSLAQELWVSGNADARTLATMIADPEQATDRMLDQWVRAIEYYVLADVFVRNLVCKSPLARRKMKEWTRSPDEWVGRAGWHLLALLALQDGTLNDRILESFLARIEEGIQKAKNYTRHAMNDALIAIGIRNAALEKKALAVAQRIGKVVVDHGETGCQTPDAAAYILKTRARKKQ
jgi:3-methyladenine DNA glycosylase AlkD